MGAKVGNIGGGMVELFSQEWNDTATIHEITPTSAQKEEIAKYDFLVTTNTQHLPISAGRAYRATCVFYVPHLLEFFNNSERYSSYFGMGVQSLNSVAYLAPYFTKNSDNSLHYCMEVNASGTEAGTSEIKFYGLKL